MREEVFVKLGLTHSSVGIGPELERYEAVRYGADGLPMEWLEVPFGPLFTGLPGGLALSLTLDGDTVAKAKLEPGTLWRDLEATWRGPVEGFVERFARLDPLSPAAYRALAARPRWCASVAGSVARLIPEGRARGLRQLGRLEQPRRKRDAGSRGRGRR